MLIILIHCNELFPLDNFLSLCSQRRPNRQLWVVGSKSTSVNKVSWDPMKDVMNSTHGASPRGRHIHTVREDRVF